MSGHLHARAWPVALLCGVLGGCSVPGEPSVDATSGVDGGGVIDAAAIDADVVDVARADAAAVDAARADEGTDAGPPDAGAPRATRCAAPTDTVSLAVAFGGACRLDTSGQLSCWGTNAWGLVRPGAGTWAEPHVVPYEGLDDVVQVSTSAVHACVVHRGGVVSCWGQNDSRELGDGTFRRRDRPGPVAGIGPADQVLAGNGTTCAHERSGRWLCWGQGGPGAVAFGAPLAIQLPTELPGLFGARRFSFGPVAAALFDDGHVESSRTTSSGVESYVVPGIDDAVDVASGGFHACALHAGGRVSCWRALASGSSDPVDLVIDDVLALVQSGVSYSLCGVRRDGSLWCWGADPAVPPARVSGATDVDVAGLGAHLCFASCSGEVRCDGPGIYGENGEGTSAVEPLPLSGVTDAVAVDGSCVLRADGTTMCREPTGYLETPAGTPCPTRDPMLLADVPGLDGGLELHAACVRRSDGSIACARDGAITTFGGLPSPAASFALFADHAVLARTIDGGLFYWPDVHTSSDAPTAIAVPGTVAELSPLALRTDDGAVYDITCSLLFSTVCSVAASPWPGPHDVTGVFGGDAGVCVRRASGEVSCRIDDPTVAAIVTPGAPGVPTVVPALHDAVEIAIDAYGLCGRDGLGTVTCLGDPNMGRLGTDDARATTNVPLADGASAVGLGPAACAVHTGRAICWGVRVLSWGDATTCPRPFASPVTP